MNSFNRKQHHLKKALNSRDKTNIFFVTRIQVDGFLLQQKDHKSGDEITIRVAKFTRFAEHKNSQKLRRVSINRNSSIILPLLFSFFLLERPLRQMRLFHPQTLEFSASFSLQNARIAFHKVLRRTAFDSISRF